MKTLLSSQLPNRWLASLAVLGLCLTPAVTYAQNEEAPAQESSEGTTEEPATPPDAPASETTSEPEGSTTDAPAATEEPETPKDKPRKPSSLKKKKKAEKSEEKNSFTLVGAAQTMPERVIRFRYVFRDATGDFGYDEDGNKTEGLDAVIHGQAFVFEYGLTSKLSLQFLGQMVSTNDVVMKGNKFKTNPLYKKNADNFINATITSLIAAGQCTDVASCRTEIDKGFGVGVPTDAATLPTGETFDIPAGKPVLDLADALVLNAARPLEGETGVSDTTLGALYNVFSDPSQMFSVGLGLRLPTGKYDVPSAYRGTGSGFTTLGLVLAYDYRVLPWFLISLTDQSEYHLTKIKRKRTSLIDNSQFNVATPTDGIPNEETYERKGLYHTPGINFKFSWSLFTSALNPLTTDLYYGKVIDAEYYLGGRSQGPAAQLSKASLGFTWDGISMNPRLPFFVSVSREVPLDGKNQTIAVASTFWTAALYYKF